MIHKYMIGASWCCNCRALKSTAEDLNYEYIDTDTDCSNVIEKFNIKVLPTFVITDEDTPLAILEQPSTKEELLKFTDNNT